MDEEEKFQDLRPQRDRSINRIACSQVPCPNSYLPGKFLSTTFCIILLPGHRSKRIWISKSSKFLRRWSYVTRIR